MKGAHPREPGGSNRPRSLLPLIPGGGAGVLGPVLVPVPSSQLSEPWVPLSPQPRT